MLILQCEHHGIHIFYPLITGHRGGASNQELGRVPLAPAHLLVTADPAAALLYERYPWARHCQRGGTVLSAAWKARLHPTLVRLHLASGGMAAADDAAEGHVPLLVRVLAGNPATGASVLACLDTGDATHLRQLHPAVAGVVANMPWCDMGTLVVDVVRWRAGLPAAVGARLSPSAGGRDWLMNEPEAAALGGLTHLDLCACEYVTDDVLLRLPPSLCSLNVRDCNLTSDASFAHLTALTVLDCCGMWVVGEWTDGLAPSLQELDIGWALGLSDSVSLAHLRQLRVLHTKGSWLRASTLASLPPSLEELHAMHSTRLTATASFAHLTALCKLDVSCSSLSDASLATMPPCLVSLNAHECEKLTPAAALPHLPALRLLDVSGTAVGDALMTSLPATLIELRMAGCSRVTAGATLDHVCSLRVLHCIGTGLAPVALAACRDRGCAVPAASVLRGHTGCVGSFVVLGDGRLASCDTDGGVQLWNVAAAGEATAVPVTGERVCALAAMQDGCRLAIGTAARHVDDGCVEVWDVVGVSPARRATINCCSCVWALAVLLDGRLAVGCYDGKVRVVDVDAGAVSTTLAGHTRWVIALAVLPNGALASGSDDTSVRVWDVGAGACGATLAGHTGGVLSLVVLSDGRLASGARDSTVRLWDVGARACVGVLCAPTNEISALAALPDGRQAAGSADGTIRVWDTRLAAAVGASRAAGAVPAEVVGELGGGVGSLLSLPDGRLACGGGDGTLYLLDLPPAAAY